MYIGTKCSNEIYEYIYIVTRFVNIYNNEMHECVLLRNVLIYTKISDDTTREDTKRYVNVHRNEMYKVDEMY